MSIKYLSPSGLTEVWSNIKTYIASKIPSKIITGLSIKGRTITYTNSDGTTGTLTTQDTDTTYASMSAAEATTGTATTARSISAKVLHDKITSITNTKANDADVVHKSGNETISGAKTFAGGTSTIINLKNERMANGQDDTVSRLWSISLTDKNNEQSARILRYVSADNSSGCFLYDYYKGDSSNQVKMGPGHTPNGQGFVFWDAGIKNNTYPSTNNTYTLGTSTLKWKAVYATTYYGNLVGGLTLNQTSLKMTVKDSNSETTRTKDVILANSSNTDYGINVAFGGSGNTVVGAGESYTAQLNELAGNLAENLYLTADNNIYFKPGANTFANAKTVTLSSAAELSGLAKVTSTSFVGALTGNVTGNANTATKATQDASGNVITATYATKTELNTKANDSAVVHRSGDETINGAKTFTEEISIQKSDIDLMITPTSNKYHKFFFKDKNKKLLGTVQYAQRSTDVNDLDLYVYDKNSAAHGIQITTDNALLPIGNNYSLGSSSAKWKDVYATTFHGNLVGNADTATKATTQATSDNSTKIATTAWVRTYVNSAVGSGSVGTTITAYWGSSSSTGNKWAMVSALNGTERVSSTTNTFTPVVGQIYSGSQLYSTATPGAGIGDTGPLGVTPSVVYARLDLSGAFNSSYKYLCTTAVGVNATASVDVTGNTAYGSSGPHTTITGYGGLTKTVQGGKSTFLRVQ